VKYLIVLIAFITACQSGAQDADKLSVYKEEMKAYQDSVTLSFISGANGVLDEKALADPHAIPFFAPDEAYRILGSFQRIEGGDTFEMKTSTDRLPLYKDHGILSFSLRDDSLSLHIYQSIEHPEYFFCPFKDLTNGQETYGAGRYLDFSADELEEGIIDFNLCYNPYCAYNVAYSCPIPPRENHLSVRIEAGVKKYK
jgi:uncharacterized protein (DUF1684 family)